MRRTSAQHAPRALADARLRLRKPSATSSTRAIDESLKRRLDKQRKILEDLEALPLLVQNPALRLEHAAREVRAISHIELAAEAIEGASRAGESH